MSIIKSFSQLWTGLTHLDDLLFCWPVDLKLLFMSLLVIVAALGIKRIFLS